MCMTASAGSCVQDPTAACTPGCACPAALLLLWQMVSRELEKECVVVFDEAHNIDNVCIEALSVNLRKQTLEGARRNLTKLNNVRTCLRSLQRRSARMQAAQLAAIGVQATAARLHTTPSAHACACPSPSPSPSASAFLHLPAAATAEHPHGAAGGRSAAAVGVQPAGAGPGGTGEAPRHASDPAASGKPPRA